MNGVSGHASPAPAMSANTWDRALAASSRRAAEHFIGLTLRCGSPLRDEPTRWRALTTDGRELSTMRSVAPLVPGFFAECGPDISSRAAIDRSPAG